MSKQNLVIRLLWVFIILVSVLPGQALRDEDPNFFKALDEGDLEAVTSLIREDPCRIHREDPGGRTAIFHAIMKKNPKMAELLIRKGALLRVGDRHLRAPIHYAGFLNDIPMVRLLLDHGAIIDTRAIGGATPLIHSSLTNRIQLSRFLVNNGADINIQCNALTTPLYFAVLNDNGDYLTFLLDQGADMDIPDFLDRTPLVIAVRDGFTEMVDRLICLGADCKIRDRYSGRNLLHLASIQGHEKTAEILIDRGLQVNSRDGKGYTPLDYANRYGHPVLAEMLKNRGGTARQIMKSVSKEAVLEENLNPREARIIKLQNGGWGIKTRNRFLILGYSEMGRPPVDPSILNGYLTAEALKNQNPVVLDLEFHPHRARYALQGRTPLYSFQDQLDAITFILNDGFQRHYQGYWLRNAHFPQLNETLKTSGLKVTAVPSYLHNRGYFLQCDGLNIFWLSTVSDSYLSAKKDLRAIEYAALHFPRIDILILGTPGGIGPEKGNGMRAAFMETRTLNPYAVFFMGKPHLERRIFHQVKRRIPDPGNIWISENPGDSFFYSRGKIKPR